MKLRRREVEVFSLSFLDCICCGFGALILLLVLTEFGQPHAARGEPQETRGAGAGTDGAAHEIRGESDLLNRDLKGKIERLERERMRVARLAGDLTSVQGQYSASRSEASVTNIVEGELVSAYQTLTAEMQRLLKQQPARRPSDTVGGIPVDSEYIIFIVDTSSSMTTNHWDAAIEVLREILDIYPQVKGIAGHGRSRAR